MRQDSVGLAKQTGAGPGGLGTANAVPSYYLPVESGSAGFSPEEMTAEETIGHPFPTDRDVGTHLYTPSFSGKCRAASLVRLLSAYWGDPVTTQPDAGGAPTAYQHVQDAALAAALVPRAHSLLLNRTDPDPAITDLVYDAIGQDLTLSIEPNEWLSFEANWIARANDPDQPEPVVTADLTRRFTFYETKAYVSVDGGAEEQMDCRSFELGYSMNVPDDDFVLGSRELYEVAPGNRDSEVTFTTREKLKEWYRRAMLEEPESCKFRLEALGPIIGGAIRYKFELIVFRAQEVEAPADVSAADKLTGIDVTVRPAYDPATSKFVQGTTVNTVATY
jgi:hypothetical protein